MDHDYYVLHVKQGYEERAQSIGSQFSRLGLPLQWILEYDVPEISAAMLEKYQYRGTLRPPEISCCLKHIRAWEKIAAGSGLGGFVFEDDVLLDLKKFVPVTRLALAEFARSFPDRRGCICFGNGCALHVPWTRVKKGRYLYGAEYVRAADSYWLSRETAALILERLKRNGFSRPADHLLDELCNDLHIPILWAEPSVVSQGSHTGRFSSSIQVREQGSKTGKKLEWLVKRIRRKYLYPLLGIDLTRR